MTKSAYFTKSLFKKALECPTKLYYAAQPETYENRSLTDPFLKALAAGGFQVGALARMYFPEGVEIRARDAEGALAETQKLLERSDVTLFEPALRCGPFMVRVDILVKRGDRISIHEVKAKSIGPDDLDDFYDQRALKRQIYKLKSKWEPYFQDLAFQTMVVRGACPDQTIHPHLMLADKSKLASVSGLNQLFLLTKGSGADRVRVAPGTDRHSLGQKILMSVDAGEIIDRLLADPRFAEQTESWASAWRSLMKIPSELSKTCKSCEFPGGFQECWSARLHGPAERGKLVIDLWNFPRADALIAEGRLRLDEVVQEDLKMEGNGARQWLQVQGERFADVGALRDGMALWKWPLHCIDFETTAVAIPFHAGRRPYEQIAFQFSHHVIDIDGSVRHAGEYLHPTRGEFPNFAFVRALKSELEHDEGTIFRYAMHENTILRIIREQLAASEENDKEDLIAFIDQITVGGPREMVDLLDIVKRCYYSPLMKGSNSIKKVLPAVIAESPSLQKRYRDRLGPTLDPYKELPSLFEGLDPEEIEGFLSDGDELADGGAAMMAYARMQFTEMSDLERERLRQGLLVYCELDTLAMVMLIEHFQELAAPHMSWGIMSR